MSQSLQRTAETAWTKKKKGEGHSEAGRLSASIYLSFQGAWEFIFSKHKDCSAQVCVCVCVYKCVCCRKQTLKAGLADRHKRVQ